MRWCNLPVLAFLGSSFVACVSVTSVDDSSTDEPQAAAPTSAGLMTPKLNQALSIKTSRAVAEALVLYDRSLSGTSWEDFAGASFVHMPVVDFADRPFEDLVFVNGLAFHPDSPYVSCKDGTLTAAVGATHAQMPVSWSRCGTDLEQRILTLTNKVGADMVDALVGAEASTYLLRTLDGNYWDVGSGKLLTPEQVGALREPYEAAWAKAETNGTPESLHESWDMFDVPEEEVAQFTRDDGSLDLDQAIPQMMQEPSILEQVEAAQDGTAPPKQIYSTSTGTCYRYWFFGWHTLGCDRYEQGYHADGRRTQAHYPNQFSGFTVPKCVGSGTDTNVAGCGPAAFASMTDWMWRRGQPIPGAGFSHGNEPYTNGGHWALRPNQVNLYKQVETAAIGTMQACSLGSSGTLTLPWNFVSGANAWLSTNAPGVSLHDVTGTFVANRFMGESFASPLRNQIGLDRGPAVAGFHIDGQGGAFDYHYSPVARYFVERPYGWFTKTRIESIDGYSSYLTNPWSMFSAVYWLGGNIGGCRFGDEKYAWSCNGPIPGYTCIQVNEPSDPYTWNDNYFCYNDTRYSFAWSYAGPISGMSCTQILEAADPHTWSDNYLCTNGPSTSWTSWWNDGEKCFRWSEPSDPHTWDDNFLCEP